MKTTDSQKDFDNKDFVYVKQKSEFLEACDYLKNVGVIGIDLECENNLHHYGSYISIIQMSCPSKNFVFDVLNLSKEDFEPLKLLFENESVQKIFHDVSFDLRILNHQFDCKPKNIFDTQLAAILLGKKSIGLGKLLEEYFHVQKEEKFQMADWTKRPITREMLSYAVKDTFYLLKLKEVLEKELEDLGRTPWLKEELNLIEKKVYDYKEQTFLDLSGIRKLKPKELSRLKALFETRELLARKVDKPAYFVMNSKKMFDLALYPPSSVKEWANLKHVHPIIKYKASMLFNVVKQASQKNYFLPSLEKRKSFNEEQKRYVELLRETSKDLSDKLGLQRHIIISNEEIKIAGINFNLNHLAKWKKELLEKELNSKKIKN